MVKIGIDIGTGKIVGTAIGENNAEYATIRKVNSFQIKGGGFEHLQDADAIVDACTEILDSLLSLEEKPLSIGICTQMHGGVYIDENYNAVSPLFTWQDERGKQLSDGISYSERIKQLCGYTVPSGYAAVTHFYNLQNGLVPKNAKLLCTVGDYLAFRLSKPKTPYMDASNACSFGLFNINNQRFDEKAIKACGMEPSLFPAIGFKKLGCYKDIPVYSAIGDNQASYLGAVGEKQNAVLVNLGTGGQVSCVSDVADDGFELRPYFGKLLSVGARLCGGYAFKLLHDFYESILKTCGCSCDDIYAAMLKNLPIQTKMHFVTSFSGERDKNTTASVDNLTADNFDCGNFTLALLNGIVDSHYVSSPCDYLVGSGNGLRKNPLLQKLFSERYGKPMLMTENEEEAARGAALSPIFAKD